MKELVFVSSVQSELGAERRAVADFIRGHVLLRRFFDVFLFEELPATDRRADELYLEKVDHAAIYLGLFGCQYGSEDAAGVSPTQREFERATQKGKCRLIFLTAHPLSARAPKMQGLVRRAENQLVRRRFEGIADLTAGLFASLIDYLEEAGALRQRPLLASPCPGASLRDVSADKIAWFLQRARAERQFSLHPTAPPLEALTHLNLLDGKRPTHSAILLFGRNPQRFLPAAELKCLHFHGTEVRKPIPSYQLFKHTIFDQIDQAVDFVMSRLARTVAARDEGPSAPVEYEIPQATVVEAIVNAVVHRAYSSDAAVQVHVFSDRVEVWNPGELPHSLTPELLREEHSSIPRNPLLADALFLVHYIEKAGTGTLDMINLCLNAGLPEPTFEQRGGQFVVTLWRDWLTDAVLDTLVLNDRQKQALHQLKTEGRLTNAAYQRITGATKKTASRDLEDLVVQGVLHRVGTTGRGTHYRPGRKGDIKGTKGTSWD
jgi:ATP-dependent DNA helicase RecG